MEHNAGSSNFNSFIERVEKLKPEAQALWGKMNVAQMMAHLNASLLSPAGEIKGRQGLMGKILGRFMKPVFVGDKPFAKNSPTAPEFVMAGQKDFQEEKTKLIALLKKVSAEQHELGNRVHIFLGKITKDEWLRNIHKHLDHHLSQFGA